MHHIFVIWRLCLLGKILPERFSSTLQKRLPSGVANQLSHCQTPGNRFLDTPDTSTENIKHRLNISSSGGMKVKISHS